MKKGINLFLIALGLLLCFGLFGNTTNATYIRQGNPNKKILPCVNYDVKTTLSGVVFDGDLGLCKRDRTYYGSTGNFHLSLPKIGVNAIDDVVYQSGLSALSIMNQIDGANYKEVSLWLDCQTITSTSKYYSSQCGIYQYVGGAHGMFGTYTINYDLTKIKPIGLQSLLTKRKLQILSKNLYNYFVISLNATDQNAQDLIKDGLKPVYDSYSSFTIIASESKVIGLKFYFDPYTIAPRSEGLQTVTVDYPSLKVKGY